MNFHTPTPLTSDVTYRGRTLTDREYARSLEILRAIALAGSVSAWETMGDDDVTHVAWVAIGTAGLTTTFGADSSSPSMTWNRIKLSALGELYLSQRTEGLDAEGTGVKREGSDRAAPFAAYVEHGRLGFYPTIAAGRDRIAFFHANGR